MTYWEQRTIDALKRAERVTDGYIPELTSTFEQAKRELRREIEAFWARYAQANKITLAQAQELLSFEELKQFRGNLKAYEKLARDTVGTYDLQLENLSIKARLTRLEALQFECETILQRLYQSQREGISGTVAELYKDSYYRRLFEIEQDTGYRFQFANLSEEAIQQVLRYPVSGTDLSTRLWRQDIDTGFKIRETLNEMFTTGKPPQFFAERMQEIIGVRNAEGKLTGKQYEAYRLLYNEASFAMEQAHFAAYEEDGTEEYEFVATLSEKTCPVCGKLDGRIFRVSDRNPGVNCNPMHVNCRCTTVPHIAGPDERIKRTRMARDPETGKSVRVEAQSFKEWKSRNGLDKTRRSGIMKSSEILIGRSLGAAAHRDTVRLPSGEIVKTTEGTKITKVKVFAGKGTKTPIRISDYLEKRFGAPATEWKKVRGDGYVDTKAGSRHAELHWFESQEAGRVLMKVKRWFDEG